MKTLSGYLNESLNESKFDKINYSIKNFLNNLNPKTKSGMKVPAISIDWVDTEFINGHDLAGQEKDENYEKFLEELIDLFDAKFDYKQRTENGGPIPSMVYNVLDWRTVWYNIDSNRIEELWENARLLFSTACKNNKYVKCKNDDLGGLTAVFKNKYGFYNQISLTLYK